MVFKNHCVLVLRVKLGSALERLMFLFQMLGDDEDDDDDDNWDDDDDDDTFSVSSLNDNGSEASRGKNKGGLR